MRAQVSSAQRPAAVCSLRGGHHGQRGLTLIEMLVALSVIAIGFVGIAYGFSAVVRSSGNAQTQATLDGAARYVADSLQASVPDHYVPCATSYTAPTVPAPYGQKGVSWPGRFPVAVSNPTPTPGYQSLEQCTATSDDYGVQEITVTVSEGAASLRQVVWVEDGG